MSQAEKLAPSDGGTPRASLPPSLGAAFGVLITSAAVSRGVPFLVNVAVAHKLTPHEFGIPTVHFALVRRHVWLSARESSKQGRKCTHV